MQEKSQGAATERETISSSPGAGRLKSSRKEQCWWKRWNCRPSLENGSSLGQQGRENIYQAEGMRMVGLPFLVMTGYVIQTNLPTESKCKCFIKDSKHLLNNITHIGPQSYKFPGQSLRESGIPERHWNMEQK